MSIPYSADKVDLYSPAKQAVFFPDGRPSTDAALCVELARLVYSRRDGGFALDRDRIRTVLDGIAFTGCEYFENTTRPNTPGSHALLAVDAKIRLAVLAFRGTDADDLTNLLHDAAALPTGWSKGGRVHRGFAAALQEVWNPILATLQTLGGYRVLFTGHSLGAAMAVLAATLSRPDALHTFGCPRVGNALFTQLLDGLDHHRYVDCCDAVTRVPPKSEHYVHAGALHYIDVDRGIRQLSTDDEHDEFIIRDRLDGEKRYVLKYIMEAGNVRLRGLADHAPVNYVLPVMAAAR